MPLTPDEQAKADTNAQLAADIISYRAGQAAPTPGTLPLDRQTKADLEASNAENRFDYIKNGTFTPRLKRKLNELPLAWNWCSGQNQGDVLTHPTPLWQRQQMDDLGWKIMPHCEFYFTNPLNTDKTQETTTMANAGKAYASPIAIIGDNVLNNFSFYTEFTSNNDPDAPDDHAWRINAVSNVTSTNFLSPYSEHAPHWYYRLGYIFGTCDQVVLAASIYPNPPVVYFMDNNEGYFGTMDPNSDADKREADTPIQDVVDYVAANPGDASDAELYSVRSRVFSQAYKIQAARFNEGFRDGLATHNKHWSEVAGWCAYTHLGYSYGDDAGLKLDSSPDWRVTKPDVYNLTSRAYRYSGTGGLYMQPWYSGGKDSIEAWNDISNEVGYRQDAEWTYGVTQPLRTTIMWEGLYNSDAEDERFLPATEDLWKAYCRASMWMTRAELFGHFADSNNQVTWRPIREYYTWLNEVVLEVHGNSTLKEFWRTGTLLKSIRGTAHEKESHSPSNRVGQLSYWQFVDEDGRYTATARTAPELADGADAMAARVHLARKTRSGADNDAKDFWWTDLSSTNPEMRLPCFILYDTLIGDTRYLINIAQLWKWVNEGAAIGGPFTIRFNHKGSLKVIDVDDAPTSGAWYIHDTSDDSTTRLVV